MRDRQDHCEFYLQALLFEHNQLEDISQDQEIRVGSQYYLYIGVDDFEVFGPFGQVSLDRLIFKLVDLAVGTLLLKQLIEPPSVHGLHLPLLVLQLLVDELAVRFDFGPVEI